MLRQESLDAVLRNHGYYQRSLQGLRENHPLEFVAFRSLYLQAEAYAELDVMVHKEALIDKDFTIWVKRNCYAHLIEKKKLYNLTEMEIFSEKFEIPYSEFEEIALSTGSMVRPSSVTELSATMQGPVTQDRTQAVGRVIVSRSGPDTPH